MQWNVARLFVVVVLGHQHVCEPEALVVWVSLVNVTARVWVAPQGLRFSARCDGGPEWGKLVQGNVRDLADATTGGVPVLGRARLAEWALRRFASSTGVAPSMMFSSRSGLSKSADHSAV